jgi:hypothetical protein
MRVCACVLFCFHVRLRSFNRLCFCIYTARKNAHYLSTPQLSTSFDLFTLLQKNVTYFGYIFLCKKINKKLSPAASFRELVQSMHYTSFVLAVFQYKFELLSAHLLSIQMYIHLKYYLHCGCILEFFNFVFCTTCPPTSALSPDLPLPPLKKNKKVPSVTQTETSAHSTRMPHSSRAVTASRLSV